MDLIFSKRNFPDNSRYKNEFETERRRRFPYWLKTIKLSSTLFLGTSTRQNQANIYNESF